MEKLTAEMVDKRATEAAAQLIKELHAFNQGHSGPDPLYSPDYVFPFFISIFARLLADKCIIVPPKT